MKRLLLLALICLLPMHAQETGSGAAVSAQKARDTTWKNWVFAGVALAIAAAGITIVTLDQGADAQ